MSEQPTDSPKPTLRHDLAYYMRSLMVDLPNLSLLTRRRWDAVIVTQHHAGTHWLVHMLTELMADVYDTPRQTDIDDMRVIARHKEKPAFSHIPAMAHSHKIPSWLTHAAPLRWGLRYPRYVVLVRDIRTSLVSLYEKHREEYDVPFSELVQGDPFRRRFRKDVWRDIRFFNAWARVKRVMPQALLLLRYEDLKADPASQLRRVWEHLQLTPVDDDAIARAIENSSKERMLAKQDAQLHGRVVRDDPRHAFEWYTPADQAFFTAVCRRHLRDWFGYRFDDWTLPASAKAPQEPRTGAEA